MVLWWFKIGRLNLAQVKLDLSKKTEDFLKIQVSRVKKEVGGECGRLEEGIGEGW